MGDKYKKAINEHRVIETSANITPYIAPPIVLRAKKHYKATDINKLLALITKQQNGEYIFNDKQRVTKNDGLIFTPQENNFLMSYDPGALVKWKFLEKNTIDLKVKTPYIWRNRLDLFAGGKGQSDICFASVNMAKIENRNKFEMLLKEMKALSEHRHGFVASFIIECAWNFERLEWELVQNRPDKNIANYITVCTDTLRVMMDNVTENELCEACKPIHDMPDANEQSYGYQDNDYQSHHSNNNNDGNYSNSYH